MRGQILSRYHRYAWIGWKTVEKGLFGLTNFLDIVRLKTKDRARFNYAKVSLKDKYVEDFGPIDVKIPLKWDSGAQEVVSVSQEAAQKHNGVRFILFKPGSGHKGGIKR